MGDFVDVYGQREKNEVMKDTWGHFYPKPGCKYYGKILVAVGEYGDLGIVKSDFPGLDNSPQRYELEHTIFDNRDLETGVYNVKCGIWFYKNSDNMYLINKPIGKLIKVQIEKVC